MNTTLEGVRAVRPDRELELEKQLVGDGPARVIRAPVLTGHRAELARPVGQDHRLAFVEQQRVVCMIRSIVARTSKPAAPELVIARDVIPESPLQTVWLLTMAPNQFGPADEGAIDGPPQRLVSDRGIDAVESGGEAPEVNIIHDPRRVVRMGVGRAEVQVGAFGDVLIETEMPQIRQIAALARLEKVCT